MTNISEFDIINKYFKKLAQNKDALFLNNDVAKISHKINQEIIISKDLLSQDIHFNIQDGGYKIAKKALLSNLSDIASSGAKPYGYLLGFSINNKIEEEFIKDFCQGISEIQDQYNIKLLGGDTIKAKSLTFSITIFGHCQKNQILLRQNAKDQDLIYVSGTIGDSYLGLKNKNHQYFCKRHFFPNPQIKLGQELIKHKISKCASDVSDGLLLDIKNICQSSNLSAKINFDKIPISPQAQNFLDDNSAISKLDLISGGEDYELIFSVTKKNQKKVEELAKKLKIKITEIGYFQPSLNNKHDVFLFDSSDNKIIIKNYGYSH